MAANTGTATIDFGAFPGSQEASVTVSDPTIVAGSKVEAFFSASSSTADHTAADHRYAPLFMALTAGDVVASTGFTIHATAIDQMQGTFVVSWVWAG